MANFGLSNRDLPTIVKHATCDDGLSLLQLHFNLCHKLALDASGTNHFFFFLSSQMLSLHFGMCLNLGYINRSRQRKCTTASSQHSEHSLCPLSHTGLCVIAESKSVVLGCDFMGNKHQGIDSCASHAKINCNF